jgi:hypothetical protein
MHDAQAFSRAIRPDPRASHFINPQSLTPERRVEAARRLETLQIRRRDDVLLRGKPVYEGMLAGSLLSGCGAVSSMYC